MAVFGLDFGTTNSLAAYVEKDSVVPLLHRDRPHPSVVWYHGTERIVGSNAKAQLGDLTPGVIGDLVRSPKRYLGSGEAIHVAGRTLRPSEVVAEILRHIRQDALSRRLRGLEFDRAVMTIPVNLSGRGRQELRDAALQAGIHVDQFVHEPLAALYGHLRARAEMASIVAGLRDQVVLVFDWGGGTLDLTLCRFDGGVVSQVQSVGDDQVGGDRFDERLRALVLRKHEQQHNLLVWPPEVEGGRARLLEACEVAKIDLSLKTSHTLLVRNFLRLDGSARDLHMTITQIELQHETADLVSGGIHQIDRLLDSAGQKDAGVAFCLATGGMARMPYIQEQLIQRFSLSRLQMPARGDCIIAEGAAWIAHDRLRLRLAKPFEILDADNCYVPIIKEHQALPIEGEHFSFSLNLYIVDPRDGIAKLQFARPKQPTRKQPSDARQVYTTLTVHVDPRAKPLVERIAVNLDVDHNLVVHASAESTIRGDRATAEIHDLEFGLGLSQQKPKLGIGAGAEQVGIQPQSTIRRTQSDSQRGHASSAVSVRSNVTRDEHASHLIPGEMLEALDVRRVLPERQEQEHRYYKPCLECGRLAYHIDRDGCDVPGCTAVKRGDSTVVGTGPDLIDSISR